MREYIKEYLQKDTSRSNKSNLIKLLISDKKKFNEINSFISFGTFKQKLYHYIHNALSTPSCLICEGKVNWNEKDFCYRETCSRKCSGKLNLYRKNTTYITHPILSTKDEYYNYFVSGKIKVTESSVSKYYPELLVVLDNSIIPFNERVYCYLKDTIPNKLCKNCKLGKVSFDTFSKGYNDYCSVRCSSNSNIKKNNIVDTVNKKYGVNNVGTVTRKKALETMDNKYGSHISLTEQYKEKFKETSIKNYGVDHPFKSSIVKQKISDKNLEIYGTIHPMKNNDILNKSLQTRKNNGYIFKWSEEDLKLYERYRQKVTYLSEKNYKEHIDKINPMSYTRGHLTYHLDHIYPVILGFINNIDAELISDYKNLQILPHLENRSKSSNTDMTVEDFRKLFT
jgi:hypothetical protein